MQETCREAIITQWIAVGKKRFRNAEKEHRQLGVLGPLVSGAYIPMWALPPFGISGQKDRRHGCPFAPEETIACILKAETKKKSKSNRNEILGQNNTPTSHQLQLRFYFRFAVSLPNIRVNS